MESFFYFFKACDTKPHNYFIIALSKLIKVVIKFIVFDTFRKHQS